MKALLLAFILVGPTSAIAKQIVVFADITLLPDSGFAEMPKDPGCDKPDESGLVTICLGGWSRYKLSSITRVDGTRIKETVALIYADPVLGGRWRLTLQRLDPASAATYGATYKAVSTSRAIDVGVQR